MPFDACGLHIPHKRWAIHEQRTSAHLEEDNYAYLEQWSLRMRPCYVKGGGIAPVAPGLFVADPAFEQGSGGATYTIGPLSSNPLAVSTYDVLALIHTQYFDGTTPAPMVCDHAAFSVFASLTYTAGPADPAPGAVHRVEVWAAENLNALSGPFEVVIWDAYAGTERLSMSQCWKITTSPDTHLAGASLHQIYSGSPMPTTLTDTNPSFSTPEVRFSSGLYYTEQHTALPTIAVDMGGSGWFNIPGVTNGITYGPTGEGSPDDAAAVNFTTPGYKSDLTAGPVTVTYTRSSGLDLSPLWKVIAMQAAYIL